MSKAFEFVGKSVFALVLIVALSFAVVTAFGAAGYPLPIGGMGREYWYGVISGVIAMSVTRFLKI